MIPGLARALRILSYGKAFSADAASTTGAPQDPPMSDHLAAGIRAALARVERGQVVDLGSFAQRPRLFRIEAGCRRHWKRVHGD